MKKTVASILKLYNENKKISMVTSYDYSTAKAAQEAQVDMILVGDSLGMVMLGYENTINVTINEMEIFTHAVTKGANESFVVSDMPFLSCGVSVCKTIKNAGTLIKAGAQAVKIEGANDEILKEIKALTDNGIAVMGHLGFTPQYINAFGGFKVQSKTYEKTAKMLEDAKKLEEAGVFAIVLEMVPSQSAKFVTENINIPTIGIGAGVDCSGQVLVVDDLIGRYSNFTPKFAKKYANVYETMVQSISEYKNDVVNKNFPNENHCFHLSDEELNKLKNKI
ncbi:MAG: 3-methyl-2-oxobutanoate hydroxymethyltransferase [Candidatus Melainabacteria bacterium LEY3_CP_29_8]|nr:MAG: 3-methyl-2-oxobutanoate hydroxymethyltransferase [Candidatus Melainabacteria bacterium LEY3_CP_29_8]